MSESSKSQSVEDRARAIAEPLIAAEGLELLEVEFVREQAGWVLRLFIDKPGGQVGVDECQAASKAVDTAFDVEDLVKHEYSLEVSSPGLDRPLRKPEHYQRVVGKKVRVKTFGPLFEPPRKTFLGILTAVGEQGVTIDIDGAGPFTVPFKEIAKANLEFSFGPPGDGDSHRQAPKGGGRGKKKE